MGLWDGGALLSPICLCQLWDSTTEFGPPSTTPFCLQYCGVDTDRDSGFSKIPPNRCLDMVINKKGWADGNVGTAEYYAKYLMLFWGWCSTRPHYFIHILPPDCLNCNWLFVNLAAAPDCVQLVPKYFSKVKLCSWQSPNISVWNNETSGKWERWWKFGSNL